MTAVPWWVWLLAGLTAGALLMYVLLGWFFARGMRRMM